MKLYCPMCRTEDSAVAVRIDDRNQFYCHECNEEFTREAVVAMINGVKNWNKVLTWCDSFPTDTTD